MGVESLLEQIARAVGVTPTASVTVGTVFVAYKKSRTRGRAWQLERNLLRPFVVRFWRRAVAELAAADWKDHRTKRSEQPTRTGRPACDLTINLELSRTRGMFAWALKAGIVARNPLGECKRVKT